MNWGGLFEDISFPDPIGRAARVVEVGHDDLVLHGDRQQILLDARATAADAAAAREERD